MSHTSPFAPTRDSWDGQGVNRYSAYPIKDSKDSKSSRTDTQRCLQVSPQAACRFRLFGFPGKDGRAVQFRDELLASLIHGALGEAVIANGEDGP
jgi:hypothetical protein